MRATPLRWWRRQKRLRLLLIAAAAVAVLQQQLLWHRPPRLLELRQASASSGPAALSLRFSRPIQASSVTTSSKLQPPLPFTIQGEGNPLLLLPAVGARIEQPLELRLAGRDKRGLSLPTQRWFWDPRPDLLAVVPVDGGEQVRLLTASGAWTPLTPVWPAITQSVALGDGSGLGLVSRNQQGEHQVWKLELKRNHLTRRSSDLGSARAGRLQPFSTHAYVFASLSSNASGDLLVQAAAQALGPEPPQEEVVLWERGGSRRSLGLDPRGPIALVPQGGAMIVPESDGLALRTLPPRPARRQLLPGSRDLSSFRPVGGRPLPPRHWPDFRRSLELVEPAQAPKTLWLGQEALLASACSRGGDRVWALLLDGIEQPVLTVLALSRDGGERRQRLLGWELEPGTGLSYDPTTDRLLLALRPLQLPAPALGSSRAEPQAGLIDATSLELTMLKGPVRQVSWLPPG
ncbi:hypothetical protein KBY93_11390 [Synechococcus sp. J7-Johnson]|uniref:hypothetical protein n=1 Tax=Synechococcus sp. J7-Johnson TaxID=2823737 RepID=UPI0020CE47B2|nr:hypothetical protein [Synechococcus sp. J7-Johnson]MCP9841230.1 hypothetical protein [Synechococcus sp. J7-Johnson]